VCHDRRLARAAALPTILGCVLGLRVADCGLRYRGGPATPNSAIRNPQSSIRNPQSPSPAFVNVAAAMGIDYVTNRAKERPRDILAANGSGCAFLDYDGDGNLDILLVGEPRCALYRNEGGRFADVTAAAGLGATGHWIGVGVGDWDNDGRPDLCLAGFHCGALYHNEGGRFRDVTARSGIIFPQWGQGAAFGDVDGDGWLDLYLSAYARFEPDSPRLCPHGGIPAVCGPELYAPERGRLFQGLGGGRFREATASAGMGSAHGRSWGAMFQDYDDDGRQDLYVANDMLEGDLFHNESGAGSRGIRFRNVGLASGTAYGARGQRLGEMAVDWADYDNDGRPDLLVTAFTHQPAALFHNDGNGSFSEQSDACGVGAPTYPYVGFGAKFLDFDNDGWRDLLIANGHIEDNAEQLAQGERYRQPVQLLQNSGGRFLDRSQDLLASVPAIVARGAAFGDFDNDGRTDALVMDLEGPPLLLRNQAPGGAWLGLKLAGRQSNRDGIGARVIVTAGGRQQRLECQTSGSVLSANDPRLLFGLGAAEHADRVDIRWPSGRRTELANVPARQYVTVREP
jgi:hypothetical protein